ncbi:MAG: MBOAT family protein [Ruminococcaceae bacterium]|nr:MBOAT family protein [Oscillospiraceae bacterium]
MVFSSLLFLFRFLPIVLLGYFATPKKFRNLFLLLFSLVFYAWDTPKFLVIMLVSIAVNYAGGILVDKFKAQLKDGMAKLALIATSVIDLGILGVFKYTNFVFENINAIFGTEFVSSFVLPIGISFYTFQMMSYVIDVYRGDTPVQKNIVNFGCYVSLFPQLIAGPIVQYKTVAEQLDSRQESYEKFALGIKRFVVGLSKKVLIANSVGALWESIAAMDVATLPTLTAWLGIIAYTLQIYFDFSGYSDMAIGLGKMFGFEFLENFNYPYISKSITEFWRRWHISLGSWFRDYVYIPLGGNRRGFLIQLRNIFVVWMLTGIWHGASWNFFAWGVYFGIILIIEKLFLLKLLNKLPSFISHIYATLLFVYGWVIFYFKGEGCMGRIWDYTKALFGGTGCAYNEESLFILLNYALILVIGIIGATPLCKKLFAKAEEKCSNVAYVLSLVLVAAGFLLTVTYLVAAENNPFLYFDF